MQNLFEHKNYFLDQELFTVHILSKINYLIQPLCQYCNHIVKILQRSILNKSQKLSCVMIFSTEPVRNV